MSRFLENNKIDICLLQETNIHDKPDADNTHHKFFINPAENEYSGTMLAVRRSNMITVMNHEIAYRSYLQKITLKIENVEWHIFNIYLPHDIMTSLRIMETLKQCLNSLPQQKCSSRWRF